jgi:hypothetical protein
MPGDLKFFPERFQEKLSHDEQRKVLRLRGILTEENSRDYSLTADSV